MSQLKDIMEFPALHTFKIIGKNSPFFKSEVSGIFQGVDIPSPKQSRDSNYVSYSITIFAEDFEVLESFYKKISLIKELKFYL